MGKELKTEHNGSKDGGGMWGTREEAKTLSKKARRENAKKDLRKAKADLDKPDPKE